MNMNMEIKMYNNKESNFSIYIYTDSKGNAWFKGKEIATLLGYKDTDNAVRTHVDPEDKKKLPQIISGQVHHCFFLNESGMFSL